jgi:hypothetical protein
VNGRKVGKAMLTDGDTLTIGRVQFVVNAASGADGTARTSWTS